MRLDIPVGPAEFVFGDDTNARDRTLHGIFEAASEGKLNIDPKAWSPNGIDPSPFPAQDHIGSIRAAYTRDFTNKDITKRQIAVATYLIDKLALRAGNEKDDDEPDTVGCCTLKVGNVECLPPKKLKFEFLGKEFIQYVNTVEVEPPVYKAIGQFQAGKSKSYDLFYELDNSKLNAHLKELMPGLTAKVFRTYNASITLYVMLSKETRDGDVPEKVVVYQQANKEVAFICNHQRTVSN